MLKRLLKFLGFNKKHPRPTGLSAELDLVEQFKRMARLGQNLIVMEGR
jgi:hypothetical protein